MRVLHLVASLPPTRGGAEAYAATLCSALAGRGLDVHLACAGHPACPPPGVAVHRVRTTRPLRSGGPAPARALWHAVDVFDPTVYASARSLVGRVRPDVVHSHSFQGLGGAIFTASRTTAQVHTVHDFALLDPTTTMMQRAGEPRDRLGPFRRARSRAYRRLTRDAFLVFPSARTLSLHRQHGFVAAHRQRVRELPHGWPAPRLRQGPRCDRVRFLFAGRLTAEKGVPVLLDAWSTDGIPGGELWIAGDGPLASDVSKFVRAATGAHYVGWASPTQLLDLLTASDALLFPSQWYENFPLVVAEALLAGVPVLASELSSPPPLVAGTNGLLVDGNHAAWRRTLSDFVTDGELRGRLSKGLPEGSSDLSWEAHVDQIVRLYGEAVEAAVERD